MKIRYFLESLVQQKTFHLSNAQPYYVTDSLVISFLNVSNQSTTLFIKLLNFLYILCLIMVNIGLSYVLITAVERNGKPIGIKVCVYSH